MPTFTPLHKPRPLPRPKQTVERSVFDCKRASATSSFERAKDIAAFANHLGGTLLIGAVENNEQLQLYDGMSPTDAGKIVRDYSSAIADLCWPRPVVDSEIYEQPADPAKRVVAINVQPSLDLVSIKMVLEKAKHDFGGHAYVFPVRSGNHTRWLEPGQLAMFMTPQIRRVAVMLARIPIHAQVAITYTQPLREDRDEVACSPVTKATFERVAEEDNLVHLRELNNSYLVLPLDLVRSVYQTPNQMWQIRVDM